MKLRIVIVAVMVLLATGLYLYLNPIEKGQLLFRKNEPNTVEESVVPDDNSDLNKRPTPPPPKSPDRNPSVYFHTIVVLLGKHLPTANS